MIILGELKDFDKEVVGNAWVSDEAKRNLIALCEMGSRFGGTPSEKKAVDYILRKYTEYGLENARAPPMLGTVSRN